MSNAYIRVMNLSAFIGHKGNNKSAKCKQRLLKTIHFYTQTRLLELLKRHLTLQFITHCIFLSIQYFLTIKYNAQKPILTQFVSPTLCANSSQAEVLKLKVENVKVVIINAYCFVKPQKMRIFAAVNLTGRTLI